jgi:hypothetical protein
MPDFLFRYLRDVRSIPPQITEMSCVLLTLSTRELQFMSNFVAPRC